MSTQSAFGTKQAETSRRAVYSILAFLVAVAVWPAVAHAEYGYFHHNGFLGGLGAPEDHVLVLDPNDIFPGAYQPFNLEAWVYPKPSGHRMVIISKGSLSWDLFITADLHPALSSGIHEVIVTSVTLPTTQWTHLAVNYAFDGDDSPVNFFVNGIHVLSGFIIKTGDETPPKGHPLTIGGSLDDPKSFFEGDIDEVRVWHDARDVNDIREHRFAGIGDAPGANVGGAITAGLEYQNLVASWNFNGGSLARDFIGGHDGSYEGTTFSKASNHTPIPYNLALSCNGGPGDYVVVPDDPDTFNQEFAATIEMWLRLESVTRGALWSRGDRLVFGTDSAGGLTFRFGGASISTPPVVPLEVWTHVAVTWWYSLLSHNYFVRFYANGKLVQTSTVDQPFPLDAHDVWIGHAPAGAARPVDGYLDEVRFWHGARTQAQLQEMMFASGRSQNLPPGQLLGLWGFEGNVHSHVNQALSGTLNNGKPNGCRFSAYTNEILEGSFGPWYEAHPTVLSHARDINQTNDFPSSFIVRAPFAAFPPLGQAQDTITLPSSSGKISTFEVMLSVDHPWVGNLRCVVKHGVVDYELFDYSSSKAAHVLSFFGMDYVDVPDDKVYPAPWGFLTPASTLAQSTKIDAAGDWTVECKSQGFGGTLRGWGLRLVP